MSGSRAPGSLDWDEGVASERTVLAWERSAIASLAVAALIIRAGIVYSLLGIAIPLGSMLVLASIAEWRFSVRIFSEHAAALEEGPVAHERMLAVLVAVTVIAAAGAAVLVISR